MRMWLYEFVCVLWGGYERCVYYKGGFLLAGKNDLVICEGGFGKVGIHLDIVDSLYEVMKCLHGLYVYYEICLWLCMHIIGLRDGSRY